MPACGSAWIPSSARCTSPLASIRTATSRAICSADDRSPAGGPDRLIAGRYDARALRHQDHGEIGRARAMHHAFRHHESLEPLQIDGAVLQVDDEVPVEKEEELIVVVVLVPVILTLHETQANPRVVDLAEFL